MLVYGHMLRYAYTKPPESDRRHHEWVRHARMGPQGTCHFVVEKIGSNQDGPEQCSRTSSSSSISGHTDISRQPLPPANDAQSSARSSARRNKVYDKIMKQWEQAASSLVPMPRSSHRRVLGGQALPTRQV